MNLWIYERANLFWFFLLLITDVKIKRNSLAFAWMENSVDRTNEKMPFASQRQDNFVSVERSCSEVYFTPNSLCVRHRRSSRFDENDIRWMSLCERNSFSCYSRYVNSPVTEFIGVWLHSLFSRAGWVLLRVFFRVIYRLSNQKCFSL